MNMQKQKPIWSKILAMLCALALCISMVPAASARPSTTSTVSKVTVDTEGISEFWTESGETAIGSTGEGETIGNIRYSFSNSSLVIETTNDTKLPKTITFFAVVNYQPTITSSNDGVSAIASDCGDNWWMIIISLANATANEVILNAKAVPTYTVTVKETTEGEKGYNLIEGSSDTVKQGESYQFYVIPKTGYQAPKVTVTRGGSGLVSVTPKDGLYTVANIQSDIMITIDEAHFQRYTVNFVSGDGYSFEGANNTTIATNGTATVNYNGSVSFKVVLGGMYNQSADSVKVYANGTEIESMDGVYTIENITVDQTVSVTGVAKNTYQVILPEDWTGYTISTVDSTFVPAGGTFTFTVTPAAGYTITSVTLNNSPISLNNDNTYSITPEPGENVIAVVAEPQTYTLSTTPNDSIINTDSLHFGNNTITITPNAGYKVDSVTFDGATVAPGADNKYTIYVTGNDHQLVVTTSPVVKITLTTTVTGAGTTVVTVRTSSELINGSKDGITVTGYGTLYSNQQFNTTNLETQIENRDVYNGDVAKKVALRDELITVNNYYMGTIDFDTLIGNAFNYKINFKSPAEEGSRYGAGWIELTKDSQSWIIFSDVTALME